MLSPVPWCRWVWLSFQKLCSTSLQVPAAVERLFWIVIDFHPLTGPWRVDGLLEELRSAAPPPRHIRPPPACCLIRTTTRCPTKAGINGSRATTDRPAGCNLVEDLQFPRRRRDLTERRWNKKGVLKHERGST